MLSGGSQLSEFFPRRRHLKITQPAVSHQIGTLEDELETKLFHRTSKSVRLTREGYLFTQYAGEILKLTDRSKTRLKEFREAQPEHLRIGCRNTLELELLQPVLTELCRTESDFLPVIRLFLSILWKICWRKTASRSCFPFRNPLPKKLYIRAAPLSCSMCLQKRSSSGERKTAYYTSAAQRRTYGRLPAAGLPS